MRLLYVAVVAAAVAALTASTDGLQIVPYTTKYTSLQTGAEARKATTTETQSGYEFSTLQEKDDVLQQNDDEYEDDSDSGSSNESSSYDEERARKKRKKRKW
ncbi:hypothetical protein PF006_g29256 [Phytophthora fragariae]|uniref:RxLR effector protein n=1 Tax=Phytophthora fragariae TaxID=53985 RepID=A0A6A3Q7U1_9STRA|nr:hypothetical protein PF003_g8885 [Phytophthora fragariae]KAE9070920.1 hypothetical protein PF006_g29256 [Phytophthora fragariae]